MQFSAHHVISAMGVDFQGGKHVQGLRLGATENAAAVKSLRAAIDELFGTEQAVRRCRTHKIRNVLEKLPKEQQAQIWFALSLFAPSQGMEHRKKIGPKRDS